MDKVPFFLHRRCSIGVNLIIDFELHSCVALPTGKQGIKPKLTSIRSEDNSFKKSPIWVSDKITD